MSHESWHCQSNPFHHILSPATSRALCFPANGSWPHYRHGNIRKLKRRPSSFSQNGCQLKIWALSAEVCRDVAKLIYWKCWYKQCKSGLSAFLCEIHMTAVKSQRWCIITRFRIMWDVVEQKQEELSLRVFGNYLNLSDSFLNYQTFWLIAWLITLMTPNNLIRFSSLPLNHFWAQIKLQKC